MYGRYGWSQKTGFFTEEKKKNRPKVTKKLLARIFAYLKPYRKQMLVVMIAIIISSVLNLIPSVLTGKIINEELIGQSSKEKSILTTIYRKAEQTKVCSAFCLNDRFQRYNFFTPIFSSSSNISKIALPISSAVAVSGRRTCHNSSPE